MAGRSYAAGDEADLNDADTHIVVTVARRATYANEGDDPRNTGDAPPNPSVIPDLHRSLDPKIRAAAAQGMETAIKEHQEELRNPTLPDGIVKDEQGEPLYPEHPASHDEDIAAREAADRERDPGNVHLDPSKGPQRTVETRDPRVLTRDPAAPVRTGTPTTSPAARGSAEAAVKAQTSGPSGSHPSSGRK